MRDRPGAYTDWCSITYRPAIAELLPLSLLPQISLGQTALDIGCNTGGVALFLASRGVTVVGLDINERAISEAREHAEAEGLAHAATFLVADAAEVSGLGQFDVLTLIRVLTCFPSLESWRSLLRNAYSLVKCGGLVYIHDFRYAEGSPVYQPRYDLGSGLGWRKGNFAVNDRDGQLSFVAHHHTREEIEEITAPYCVLALEYHTSTSMNGNECEMFEFIGRKRSALGNR
jgi:SAM-dependent methyltransferase